eukprot:2466890-Rhodomonas_salina.2
MCSATCSKRLGSAVCFRAGNVGVASVFDPFVTATSSIFTMHGTTCHCCLDNVAKVSKHCKNGGNGGRDDPVLISKGSIVSHETWPRADLMALTVDESNGWRAAASCHR